MIKYFVREGELRRWAPWAGGFFLLLVAVILETGMESVCWDEEAVKAAKINEVGGCFEFWLNRYQGLAGVLMTAVGVVAAIRVGRWAFVGAIEQVKVANINLEHVAKQTKLLGAQTASVRINELRLIEEIAGSIILTGKTLETKHFDGRDIRREAFRMCATMIDYAHKNNVQALTIDDQTIEGTIASLTEHMTDIRNTIELARDAMTRIPSPSRAIKERAKSRSHEVDTFDMIDDRLQLIDEVMRRAGFFKNLLNAPIMPLVVIERLRDPLLIFDQISMREDIPRRLSEYAALNKDLATIRLAAINEMIYDISDPKNL